MTFRVGGSSPDGFSLTECHEDGGFPQGVGKVRYVRPDLRRWQAEARIGSLGRPCGSLRAR